MQNCFGVFTNITVVCQVEFNKLLIHVKVHLFILVLSGEIRMPSHNYCSQLLGRNDKLPFCFYCHSVRYNICIWGYKQWEDTYDACTYICSKKLVLDTVVPQKVMESQSCAWAILCSPNCLRYTSC